MNERLRAIAHHTFRTVSLEPGLRAGQFSNNVAELAQREARRESERLLKDSDRAIVESFAEERAAASERVTIEIGPGSRPSGLDREFHGSSAYIGIEAGINHTFCNNTEAVFKQIRQNRPSENIIPLIGKTSNHYPELTEVADDIYLTYVLDDWRTNDDLVIGDSYRMLKPGGSLVIHDRSVNALHIAARLKAHGFTIAYTETLKRLGYEEFLEVSSLTGGYQISPTTQTTVVPLDPNLIMLATKPE